MTETNKQPSEADLHAYMDGLLDAEQLEVVENYLSDNPEEAKRLAAYDQLGQALHQAYDPVLGQEMPSFVKTQKPSYFSYIRQIAAGTALLVVGASLGWSLHGQSPISSASPDLLSQGLVHPALVAHSVFVPEVRHPVEVSAEQESHLSKWLSKRLGTQLKPPHLGEVGFDLVGGRLLPGNEGPAAQFMYEDRGGKRLTLYVRQLIESREETAFRYSVENGVGVFYWVDEKLGYALIGDLAKPDLLKAAEKTYQGLNL